jgi:hypothetical protein
MKNKTMESKNLPIKLALIMLTVSVMIWSGNIGADAHAKYPNSQEQNQLNDCQVGIVGGANCGINAVQTQADGTISSPVILQESDTSFSFDRNNINVNSQSGQQNSGDTIASSGGSGSSEANGGNFVGDDLSQAAADSFNNANGDLAAESALVSTPAQESRPIENIQGTNFDPFLLPFRGD